MLKIEKINKSYTTGTFTQVALKDLTLEFRKNEFVSILGPSGSGKTTLLNIIGGLDRYDNGDLIINNKSTKKFKDKDWDYYRNNCIGFIFQSYNLIPHISVLDNVELGMVLSGVGQKKRKEKALELLDKVGLKEHAHKKPNQLSGGQMQRVAIARALANDPDIILADEPTGALDSTTSLQIMELIKEIAKDKLVIMVTHNSDLAKEYSSRVVEFKDGELINDSNPIKDEEETKDIFKIKKTAMSFLTALKLSFNNIKTKKGRTLITSFASSIGIIGIALVLSLSNGFQIQIDKFEENTLSTLPLAVQKEAMQLDEDTIKEIRKNIDTKELEDYSKKEKIYSFDSTEAMAIHINKITNDYVNYVKKMNSTLTTGITYGRDIHLNTIVKNNNQVETKDLTEILFSIPTSSSGGEKAFVDSFFDVIYGTLPDSKEDLVLVVDNKNRIPKELLEALGFDSSKEISFKDIINKEIKLVMNNDYYTENGNYFTVNSNLDKMYNSEKTITLKVSAIIRGKEDKKMLVANNMGLSYTEDLVDYIIESNEKSKVVMAQKNSNYNVLTGEALDITSELGKATKETMLAYLGASTVPSYLYIYPTNFSDKEEILEYLDNYNKDKKVADKILYTDQAQIITSLSGSIMDAITIVLIAFSAISLVVSSIMIGIITYISVLERTKEIGVLRALGARKKDIRRVFNAETFIVGTLSGILGIFIAWLLTIPANVIIKNLTDLDNVAQLNPVHAIVLVIISVILTTIGGYIPAKMASKKDPVEALRTE